MPGCFLGWWKLSRNVLALNSSFCSTQTEALSEHSLCFGVKYLTLPAFPPFALVKRAGSFPVQFLSTSEQFNEPEMSRGPGVIAGPACHSSAAVVSDEESVCKSSTHMTVTASEGYLSNTVADETGCGAPQAPWRITAKHGESPPRRPYTGPAMRRTHTAKWIPVPPVKSRSQDRHMRRPAVQRRPAATILEWIWHFWEHQLASVKWSQSPHSLTHSEKP